MPRTPNSWRSTSDKTDTCQFFKTYFLTECVQVYREHIKTVAEATRLNQELHKAKKEEVEAEEGLLRWITSYFGLLDK